jgi:hypothetical protein
MTESHWKFYRSAPTARAVGNFLARLLDPVARARGFASTALLTEWPAIVGKDLAAFTMPDKLVWPRRAEADGSGAAPPRRRPEGAILVLRVDGPRAIEVQHRTGAILDRVNTYFGYRAVAEMRFLQAPVARAEPRTPQTSADTNTTRPTDLRCEFADSRLRDALLRLSSGTRRSVKR